MECKDGAQFELRRGSEFSSELQISAKGSLRTDGSLHLSFVQGRKVKFVWSPVLESIRPMKISVLSPVRENALLGSGHACSTNFAATNKVSAFQNNATGNFLVVSILVAFHSSRRVTGVLHCAQWSYNCNTVRRPAVACDASYPVLLSVSSACGGGVLVGVAFRSHVKTRA